MGRHRAKSSCISKVASGLLLCSALVAAAVAFDVRTDFITARLGSRAVNESFHRAAPAPTPIASGTTANSATPQPQAAPTPSSRPPTSRSTGRFATAAGGTPVRGRGPLVTYAVAVETGVPVSPAAFADAVDEILGAPDGWTSQDRWSLQRRSGPATDLVVRLATPQTVDKVCATGGLRTQGYASCRVGRFVMINLTRWQQGIPEYDGDVAKYRQYVINHEVGHGLGFGHFACPGKNKLAPVMQQQTYGLDGCAANGGPYVRGRLLTGPLAP